MTGALPLKIVVYRRLKGHKRGLISIINVPLIIQKDNHYTLELMTEHLKDFLSQLNSDDASDYEEVKFVIDNEELIYAETHQ